MTTAAILDKQGQERGEKIGEKRGMLFTKRIMQIELVLKGLTKNPSLDILTIKLITGQNEADIKAIQKRNRAKLQQMATTFEYPDSHYSTIIGQVNHQYIFVSWL